MRFNGVQHTRQNTASRADVFEYFNAKGYANTSHRRTPIGSYMVENSVLVQCSPYCQVFHARWLMLTGVSNVAVGSQRFLGTLFASMS